MNSQNDSCWNLLRFVCEPAFLARSQKAWHRGWTPMQQIGLVLSVCDLSYLYTHSILNLLGLKKKKTLICFWALKNKSSYFVWNFQGTLWNSTQNILPKHWKLWFLYNTEILRALRLKNAYAFLKRTPRPVRWIDIQSHGWDTEVILRKAISWTSMAIAQTKTLGIRQACPRTSFSH